MRITSTLLFAFALCLTVAHAAPGAIAPPVSWVDSDTGRRVIRLTDEPGSFGLYFNLNACTPDGREMVYNAPDGIRVLNFATLKSRLVVAGAIHAIQVGNKTPSVFYVKRQEHALYSTNVDTGETKKLAVLPPQGGVATVNADETLAAGTYIEGAGFDFNQGPGSHPSSGLVQPVNKGKMMEQRLAAHLPMALFTIDLHTGKIRILLHTTDWLDHLLFSPTDPTLLNYCHQGPWQSVDANWTIRTDGSQNTLIHNRTMEMEIAGHEFWGWDGKVTWYDLQFPLGKVFYLAGYNVETHERTWYCLGRDDWSIHFNVSQKGDLFCGDGGDPGQVAKAPGGEWIELFHPEMLHNTGVAGKDLIHPGVLRTVHLVNMSKHDYKLEPNVRFSPDGRLVIFTSNMFGPSYVFGVEVAAAQDRK